MRLSRLRLLWLLVAAPFAATTVLPDLPHGCEMGPRAEAAPAAMAAGHHHGHDTQAPKQAPGCQCLGHACCVARVYLPASLPLLLGAAQPAPRTTASEPVSPRLTRPHYLLPVAHAPPSLG